MNKKILFVVHVDWAFISHRLPIALEAKNQGFDVIIACHFTDKKQYLINLGFKLYEIPLVRSGLNIFDEVKTIYAILSIIRKENPGLVHAITIKPVLYSGLVIKYLSRSTKFVAAIPGLGFVFSAKSPKSRSVKFLASLIYKLSLSISNKKVIFQNKSDKKILSKIANLNTYDSVIIKGSGVDLDVYRYTPEPIKDIYSVVMACRLVKDKGVYEFVEAAEFVRQQFPRCRFLLVGTIDSESSNSIRQSDINTWHTQGDIEYLGYREDIAQLFTSVNIVCLPSYYEGLPKVLIEAAACGRAVVTTDNPGCKEAIIPGRTGVTVPVRNAKALSKAILELLLNDQKRIEMGIAARQFAELEYDIDSVVKKHIDIYQGLLDTK